MDRFISRISKPASQSGQIGVVILLIMVVILTIGLSVATRTTSETLLTAQSADSARVFNAAEAGAEAALGLDYNALSQEITTGQVTSVPDTTVNYQVTQRQTLDTRVFEGVPVAVDVKNVPNGQGVVIRWSKVTCADDPAAFLASIYNVTAGVTTVRYRAIGNCARGDNFEQAASLPAASTLKYEFTLTLQTGDEFIRLHPLYNSTDVQVTATSGWTLPTQFYSIRSEARNTNGNETRIIEVNRTLPTAPAILDFAVFSGSTILK